MKKISNKVLLFRLKKLSIDLRSNYQIPYELCRLIRNLDNDSSLNEINYLKSQCEHLLRVKGYYKRFPSIEVACNKNIIADYQRVYKGLEKGKL